MNKITFFFILCCISINASFGQSSEKGFADSINCKMLTYFVTYDGEPHIYYLRSNIVVYGDTIVNDTLLQKVFTNNPFTSPVYGYFKKVNNRIYFSNNLDEFELVYDYNLSVGDTFQFKSTDYLIDTIYTVQVISTDSVYINGKMRKRIEFDKFHPDLDDGISVIWVEGIGDYNYGIVFDYGMIDFYLGWGNSSIECFLENDYNIIGTCSFYTKTEILNTGDFCVFPNPFSEIIQIKNIYQTGEYCLSIYNIHGKLVYNSIKECECIHLEFLPDGIYFMEILADGHIFRKKLVKNGL